MYKKSRQEIVNMLLEIIAKDQMDLKKETFSKIQLKEKSIHWSMCRINRRNMQEKIQLISIPKRDIEHINKQKKAI